MTFNWEYTTEKLKTKDTEIGKTKTQKNLVLQKVNIYNIVYDI